MKSGELDFLEMQTTDVEIRVLGDTAVVTGQTTIRLSEQGEENLLSPARFTGVYARQKGHWRFLARHACEIEQEQ